MAGTAAVLRVDNWAGCDTAASDRRSIAALLGAPDTHRPNGRRRSRACSPGLVRVDGHTDRNLIPQNLIFRWWSEGSLSQCDRGCRGRIARRLPLPELHVTMSHSGTERTMPV